MPKPRRLGSSSSLNRSLSRLSSSSSFSSRQSNSRIYTFLIAGGLLLLASVAFLQVHLQRAPHGSKLNHLEKGKADVDTGAEQSSWWMADGSWPGSNRELDPSREVRTGEKNLGRKMGAVQSTGDEEDESGDEDMDAGDGDEGDDDDDEDADQDRFDIDVDDRMIEDEAEDLEDVDLGLVAEVANSGEDSPNEERHLSEDVRNVNDMPGKSGQKVVNMVVSSVADNLGAEKVGSSKSVGGGDLVNKEMGISHGKPELEQFDKLGKVDTIPEWVLDRKFGTVVSGQVQKGIVDILEEGLEKKLVKNVEERKGSFFWDHALGVRKRSLENVESLGSGDISDFAASFNSGGNVDDHNEVAGDEGAAKVAVQQLRGFKEVVENWKERFNSDDELVDDNVQLRLEDVREIEDALLLNGEGAPDKSTTRTVSKKSGVQPKKGRGAFDPMNPVNNPMLQDPDTTPGTWMTKSDKEMLRAIRGDHFTSSSLQPKLLLRGNILDTTTALESKTSGQGSAVGVSVHSNQELGDMKDARAVDKVDVKQWGYFPGIQSSSSFSSFMETFLGQESCSLKVFMTWTTSAWGFTARHQRVLESLLRLHKSSCVVVFSESFDFDFFKGFVKEGYKVTVVRPNLDELLADTPSEHFAAIWSKWKETPLFYLHYTELLRLAALYKYGGIYLDMDVIVLKPLDNLHNTVGSEITANGELRLNGAVLVFDKYSPFLKKCMEEFTHTYNETLLQWNGADLLTRVANSITDESGSTWRQFPALLKIEGPFSFFPLDSSRISRYFSAPKDDMQKQQRKELLNRIYEESYSVHLWNSLTSNLVPETTSLIGTILSRSCLQCKDVQ